MNGVITVPKSLILIWKDIFKPEPSRLIRGRFYYFGQFDICRLSIKISL